MKRLFLFFNTFFWIISVFAINEFPTNISEKDIQNYLSEIYSNESDVEDIFSYIQRTNKIEYLLPFVKVFNNHFREKDYRVPSGGYWVNPINVAIGINRIDIIKEIISLDANLVSKNDKGGQYDGIEPIAYAVKLGNLEIFTLLVPYINDINNVICVGGNHKSNYSDLDVNLLSICPSEEINMMLINKGIKLIGNNIQYPVSYITDDHVNLRSGPGLEYNIVEKVNKDTSVIIIGYTYRYFSINGQTGRWINVLLNSKKLWVFEPYIYIYSQ